MRGALAISLSLLVGACTEDPSTSSEVGSDRHRCRSSSYGVLHDKKVLNRQVFRNENGAHSTFSTDNRRFIDTKNAFFKSLGTNGRSCGTCHTLESGLGLSIEEINDRFDDSCGTDPLFRLVDGANSPNEDVSTVQARRQAYSLLLKHGVIRIQIPLPETRDFDLIAVDDPTNNDISQGITSFRRPLMAANLKFNVGVMFDSREATLASQAIGATLGHAEADAEPSAADVAAIVDFESKLFTTQVFAYGAGSTSDRGATGDPVTLSQQGFTIDENRAPFGQRPFPLSVLDNHVMTVFDSWTESPNRYRAAIARGAAVFNFKPLINPDTQVVMSCSNCHNAFNAGTGSHNIIEPPSVNIRSVRVSLELFRLPGMPLYTFQQRGTNAIIKVTDPGRGGVSGKFAELGGVKVPGLRGIAARAPYFHNGLSPTLEHLVEHYDTLFQGHLTAQEKSDLVAFLKAL